MICIVYWINAIISPTCICPSLIPCAPVHTIRTDTPFMTNIITGIIKVIARLTKRFVFVSVRFASSNLSSSCFSVLNARITGSPVRISLVTRFNLSTRFCSTLNFGITTRNSNKTTNAMIITASPMIQDMDTFVFITCSTPPIARIGAYRTIRSSITISI